MKSAFYCLLGWILGIALGGWVGVFFGTEVSDRYLEEWKDVTFECAEQLLVCEEQLEHYSQWETEWDVEL